VHHYDGCATSTSADALQHDKDHDEIHAAVLVEHRSLNAHQIRDILNGG